MIGDWALHNYEGILNITRIKNANKLKCTLIYITLDLQQVGEQV